MESFLDGLKFSGPFIGFYVAFFTLAWQAVKRNQDERDVRFRESNNALREDTRRGDDRLETRIEESINLLREDMRQINARLDANSQAIHADISALTDKIEANTHDLRVEFRQLNQNFVDHLEHHEESRSQTEQE